MATEGVFHSCTLFQLPASGVMRKWSHLPGNCDGLKVTDKVLFLLDNLSLLLSVYGSQVDKFGNLWATARGGVHVFSPTGD